MFFLVFTVPARPSNLVLGSIVHDSAVASWDALMDAMWQDNGVSSPSRQYRVVLVNAAKPHSSITAATSMTLTGLDPSTTYTVQLTATNNFGEGLALEEDFTTLSARKYQGNETLSVYCMCNLLPSSNHFQNYSDGEPRTPCQSGATLCTSDCSKSGLFGGLNA